MTHGAHKQVACKIIKKKKDSKQEKTAKEVRILTGLNHVRIRSLWLSYMELMVEPQSGINRVFDVHNDETFLYEPTSDCRTCRAYKSELLTKRN